MERKRLAQKEALEIGRGVLSSLTPSTDFLMGERKPQESR